MNPIRTWGYRYQYTLLRYFIIFSHFLNDNQLCSQLFTCSISLTPPLLKQVYEAGMIILIFLRLREVE